ncbi:MAG: hypothetical protein CXT67_08395 [Methanobacteriota archaeon]|jgi:hypothetical protein|nr:MAG: hypothetical protein CXT67_08395 [Euryarchaeota archaeon]
MGPNQEYNSLGMGGVDKAGNLKESACQSFDAAMDRATYSVLNKWRNAQYPLWSWKDSKWIKRKHLPHDVFLYLKSEILENAQWEIIGPSIISANINYEFIRASLQKGVA